MPVATSFAIKPRSPCPWMLSAEGAETTHLNSLPKVRKTDFDIRLLSSTVGVNDGVLNNFKNFNSAQEPLIGLCPLSWFQCDNVMGCCIIACVEGMHVLFLGALTRTK